MFSHANVYAVKQAMLLQSVFLIIIEIFYREGYNIPGIHSVIF